MAGTKKGGMKAAATNKKLHGGDFYARIGAMGGRKCGCKGFGANPELAREAGRKGGLASSRAGVKNGEGKTERRNSMPVFNRLRKIYVLHSKSKTEKVEVHHG